MLAFFCLLVEWGIYDEVHLNRLMVGHTHWRLDSALFSAIRKNLALYQVVSPAHFVRLVHETFLLELTLPDITWLRAEAFVDWDALFKDLQVRQGTSSINRINDHQHRLSTS